MWSLKPERWGSPLVQEKYREEMPVIETSISYNNNNNNNNKIIIIIIIYLVEILLNFKQIPYNRRPQTIIIIIIIIIIIMYLVEILVNFKRIPNSRRPQISTDRARGPF